MKGKKGVEGPKSGVAFANAAIPCTSKGNVLAAAKKRKRGGAVAPMKIGGEMPKPRLDKPKRASGGLVGDADKAARSALATPKTGPVLGSKSVEASVRKMNDMRDRRSDKDRAAGRLGVDGKPMRQRGGKVGADTSPMTHAARKRPTTAHSTETNIT